MDAGDDIRPVGHLLAAGGEQPAEQIGAWVREHGSIRRADVISMCGLTPDQSKRVLTRLVEAGVLVRQGERRGAVYGRGPKL